MTEHSQGNKQELAESDETTQRVLNHIAERIETEMKPETPMKQPSEKQERFQQVMGESAIGLAKSIAEADQISRKALNLLEESEEEQQLSQREDDIAVLVTELEQRILKILCLPRSYGVSGWKTKISGGRAKFTIQLINYPEESILRSRAAEQEVLDILDS